VFPVSVPVLPSAGVRRAVAIGAPSVTAAACGGGSAQGAPPSPATAPASVCASD